ncbi:MAG: tetratricopeptide repeat protein [Bacteroidia bacterium]
MRALIVNINLALILLLAGNGLAQSAKSFYKLGVKDIKAKNYSSAVSNFTRSLELKPNVFKILVERGKANELLGKTEEALKDFNAANNLKLKEKWIYMKLADLYMKTGNYTAAVASLESLLSIDKKNIPAAQKASYSYLMIKKFDKASEKADYAITLMRYNHTSHYYKALALDSLKNYTSANLEYVQAIKLMKAEAPNDVKVLPKYKPYYTNHAIVLNRFGSYDDAIAEYTLATALDAIDTIEPKNYYVFFLRSQPYLTKTDYNNAIGDLNKCIVLNPKFTEAFYRRGLIYKKTSQFQSAISDFSKIIVIENKNADAYRERGLCNLELNNYKEAINDLSKCISINPKDATAKAFLKEASDKNYAANKEEVPPEIKLSYPQIDFQNFANVYLNQIDLIVEGQVMDKSSIQSVLVNGRVATFDQSERNPSFTCRVNMYNVEKVTIDATDIYGNKTSKSFKIGRIIDEAKLKVNFSGTVVTDDGKNVPFANRTLNITNEKGDILYTTKTDATGKFTFEKLPYDKNYLLALDVADSPFSGTKKFAILDENRNPVVSGQGEGDGKFNFRLLHMDQNVMSLMRVDDEPLMIDMKGRLLAGNEEKTPISNITLLLLNSKGDIVSTKKTDESGLFIFPSLAPGMSYSFKIFEADAKTIFYQKIIITDERGRIIKEITKDQFGFFKFELLPTEKYLLTALAAEDTDPWLKTFKLNSKKNELVIIENIYYESGSFKILPEGETILKKTIEALKNNPKLTLEVQSHTDAVAGDEYNMELSQKRAATVVDYLVANGIDKKRLTGKGFGESQVANRCINGVDCSDAEHKQNRRTVFKISYVEK